jgi:cell division protein ZipA
MEENSLRLILLVVGIIILVGIYVYDAVQKKTGEKEDRFDGTLQRQKIEPVISNETMVLGVSMAVEPEGEEFDAGETKAKVAEPVERPVEDQAVPTADQAQVIQLAVLPVQGDVLTGPTLLDAFTKLDLEFGEMGVFHYYERQDGVESQCFHVANLLEPGIFPVDNMCDFESTGIVLFFQVNASINPESAFDSMLNTARELSQMLDANLVDEEMKELTLHKIEAIQSQLIKLSTI